MALLVSAERPVVVSVDSTRRGAPAVPRHYERGFASTDLIRGTARATFLHLLGDDRPPADLVIASLSPHPIALRLEVVSADGDSRGGGQVLLQPFGLFSSTDLAHDLAARGVVDSHLVVSSPDLDARYVTYAQVMDAGMDRAMIVAPSHASAQPQVIPATAHVLGRDGTLWTTDLEIVNPTRSDARVRIDLLEAGIDNRAPKSVEATLAAGASQVWPDALSQLFDFEGLAALRIVPAWGEIITTSRTTAEVDGQIAHQVIPAFTESQLLTTDQRAVFVRVSAAGETGHGARTNLGFASATEEPIDVEITLFGRSGRKFGNTVVRLAPYSMQQMNDIFDAVGARDMSHGYAVVRSETPGARYAAYASVIDNRTGKPVFVAPDSQLASLLGF